MVTDYPELSSLGRCDDFDFPQVKSGWEIENAWLTVFWVKKTVERKASFEADDLTNLK